MSTRQDKIHARLAAQAGSAKDAQGIADAIASMEAAEQQQIAPAFLTELCTAKCIDPADPVIVQYLEATQEWQRQEDRKRIDSDAIANANTAKEALDKLITTINDGASLLDSDKREAFSKIKEGIRQSASAIYNSDADHDRAGITLDFDSHFNTDPEADFRPNLFAGLAFPAGTLSYIGARTGRGKTTVMLNTARETLQATDRRVLFITLEETRAQLLRKLILSTAYSLAKQAGDSAELDKRASAEREKGSVLVDFYRLMKGQDIYDNRKGGAKAFTNYVGEAHQYIKDLYGKKSDGKRLVIYEAHTLHTLENVQSAINEYTSEGGIVLVDYVQRLPAPYDFRATASWQKGKAASNGLFVSAKQTGAIIIAGAQFNRATKDIGTVTLNGIDYEDFDETSYREAGDIEQDAHNALGIGKTTDKGDQRRYLQVLKTREDRGAGSCYAVDFNGAYAFMDTGDKLTASKAGASSKNEQSDKADSRQQGRRHRNILPSDNIPFFEDVDPFDPLNIF